MRISKYGDFRFLNDLNEYEKELIEKYKEVTVGMATDTLGKNDIEVMKRCEELIIIIEFLRGHLKEVKDENKM